MYPVSYTHLTRYSYIPTDEGWLYAAIVKDLCLKKIVGYSFSSRIDTYLTVTALKMAVNRQKTQDNLIFHSDRGVQYASAGYREALAEYNIKPVSYTHLDVYKRQEQRSDRRGYC